MKRTIKSVEEEEEIVSAGVWEEFREGSQKKKKFKPELKTYKVIVCKYWFYCVSFVLDHPIHTSSSSLFHHFYVKYNVQPQFEHFIIRQNQNILKIPKKVVIVW